MVGFSCVNLYTRKCRYRHNAETISQITTRWRHDLIICLLVVQRGYKFRQIGAINFMIIWSVLSHGRYGNIVIIIRPSIMKLIPCKWPTATNQFPTRSTPSGHSDKCTYRKQYTRDVIIDLWWQIKLLGKNKVCGTISIRKTLSWWRHLMEIFFALLAFCAGNSPVTGEFPAHRPVTRSFDIFFDPHLNKRLRKQWWGWWFETPSHPLWRHCNSCARHHPYCCKYRFRFWFGSKEQWKSYMTEAITHWKIIDWMNFSTFIYFNTFEYSQTLYVSQQLCTVDPVPVK